MQYMASGFGWATERQRFPYHGIIGSGVLIAAATGIGAWFNGQPFLTSAFGYVHIAPLEEFEIATAALFDLGVFLAVVGAVMLALESLSRFAWQPGTASRWWTRFTAVTAGRSPQKLTFTRSMQGIGWP